MKMINFFAASSSSTVLLLVLSLSFSLMLTTLLTSTTSSSLSSASMFADAKKDLSEKRPIIRPVIDPENKNAKVNRTFLENDAEIERFRSRLPQILLKRSNPSTRIVAIGDLHGDIDAAKEIFRIAQVTNDLGHWATGKDTVIQMGDVLDRGPHGFLIMDFIQRLKQEAKAAGGELIQLLGNHELMNYMGDFRFVHPKLIEAAGGIRKYASLVQQGGKYGKIISNLPVAVIRNGTVFVHAGITEINVRQFGSIDDMNAIMRRVLNDVDRGHAIVGEHGPVWTRQNIYGALAQKQCSPTEHGLAQLTALELEEQSRQEQKVPHYSPFYKSRIHRMVVGHTIMTDGEPRTFCNGALFAIDVEMSAYMPGGGYLAYYEQLQQSVDGVQPVTLFTLPRGTWQQHPPLWFPKANTTDFGERDDRDGDEGGGAGGGGVNDDDEDGQPGNDLSNSNNINHNHQDGKNHVKLVAVKGNGGKNSQFSNGFGNFRGTFLLPVVGVLMVLIVALLFAMWKKYQLMTTKGSRGKSTV